MHIKTYVRAGICLLHNFKYMFQYLSIMFMYACMCRSMYVKLQFQLQQLTYALSTEEQVVKGTV